MTTGTTIVTGPNDHRAFTPVTGQHPLPVGVSTDSATGDAFGRLRVSDPVTLFDSQLQYDKQPNVWLEKVVGTASASHLPNESSVELSVGTASGDRLVRQTRQYIPYQPGKSQAIFCTFVFGSAKVGVRKLVGYGDDSNGVFFGQDGGGQFVLLRSNITGTPSDARKVYQSEWNLDPMDGSGPSGITLDPVNSQIAVIDIEWLGVGRVRMGLNIGGVTYYVHEFLNANLVPSVYMTTANLPIRYEIVNTAATGSPSTFKQICSQVSSEGGQQETIAFLFSSAVRAPLAVTGTTPVPIIALRHALTFNSIVNRVKFNPGNVSAGASGGTAVVQVIYNPTVTGGTWASANANSAMEQNVSATAVSGGIVIDQFFVSGGAGNNPAGIGGVRLSSRLPFGLDIDGANPVTLAIAAFEVEGAPVVSAVVNWDEVR